jgi:hypothetical protein
MHQIYIYAEQRSPQSANVYATHSPYPAPEQFAKIAGLTPDTQFIVMQGIM